MLGLISNFFLRVSFLDYLAHRKKTLLEGCYKKITCLLLEAHIKLSLFDKFTIQTSTN